MFCSTRMFDSMRHILCPFACNLDYYIWEWEDEHGRWNPYGVAATVLLEKELMNDGKDVHIEALGRNYTVDIVKNVQTNDDTGVQRGVRRQKSGI